jgi:hypothetical protein
LNDPKQEIADRALRRDSRRLGKLALDVSMTVMLSAPLAPRMPSQNMVKMHQEVM